MRRLPLWKGAIIGTLLALLAGCSGLQLAYRNGPQLGWWWLDGYLDLGGEPAARAKAGIGQWFDWHRATQLADTAALLGALQADIAQPTTAAQVCRWQQRVRDRAEPALERALQLFAPLVPQLGEPQWKALERRYAKKNAEWRREHLQPDADERRDAAVARVTEQFETLYGRLDAPQRDAIRAGLAASPFDGEAWIAERETRQREAVRTLRRLAADKTDTGRTVAALRLVVEHVEQSPDPAHRALQAQLAEHNCAFAAQVHNATTPAQRRTARDKLKGWENDLRALLAPAA